MKDNDLKIEWINALRSGKYKQTQSRLQDVDGYCCLGVLCEVMGIPSEYDDKLECYMYEDDAYEVLSDRMMNKIGLSQAQMDTLVEMNDTDNDTFETIADWIERNL